MRIRCMSAARAMRFVRLAAAILVSGIVAARAQEFSGESTLDNGTIKIGIDLGIGGAIVYLASSNGGDNLINSHDWGRQVQMSFYSGPVPFTPNGKEPHATWRGLGWNPIQSGDCYDNRSKVLAHTNDGAAIYVKCVPMQWPLDNEPGECTFESWITLEGATARVRSKIINARGDTTQYPGRGQELPAIYTNGTHYRLFTYASDAPFTNAPLRQITKVWDTSKGVNVEGGPWDNWYGTENWAALVNTDDFGVGVWSPGTYSFTGGFAGKPGAGEPKDGPTGYIAPVRREILDHNIEYAYDYVLIVGTLDAIRKHVYDHADKERLPNYAFAADRQSWTLRDAHDTGWPVQGGWTILLDSEDAVIEGPDAFWDAAAMPKIAVRAAFDTGQASTTLRWHRFNADGSSASSELAFDVIPDGVMRTYLIDLAASPEYRGPIQRISLFPKAAPSSSRRVTIESIGPSRE